MDHLHHHPLTPCWVHDFLCLSQEAIETCVHLVDLIPAQLNDGWNDGLDRILDGMLDRMFDRMLDRVYSSICNSFSICQIVGAFTILDSLKVSEATDDKSIRMTIVGLFSSLHALH